MADAREVEVWSNHAHELTSSPSLSFSEDDKLRVWVNAIHPEKCLDFGCGVGLWRNLFRGYTYTGFDQNEEMIKAARQRWPEDDFLVGGWDKCPFPRSTFDLIFTRAVLQHNKHVEKEVVLDNITRMLEPRAYLITSENTFREDNYRISFPDAPKWGPALNDGYSFTSEGWQRFMKDFGLDLIEHNGRNEYLWRLR